VVNSPQLITAVQRQAKALTFLAITNKITKYMADLSATAVALEEKQLVDWLKSTSHELNPAHKTYKALSPGTNLDAMNRATIESLASRIGELGDKIDEAGGRRVRLFEWVTTEIAIATTDGVYGPQNPYRDAKTREAFW
jgi:hypothetical protein